MPCRALLHVMIVQLFIPTMQEKGCLYTATALSNPLRQSPLSLQDALPLPPPSQLPRSRRYFRSDFTCFQVHCIGRECSSRNRVEPLAFVPAQQGEEQEDESCSRSCIIELAQVIAKTVTQLPAAKGELPLDRATVSMQSFTELAAFQKAVESHRLVRAA